ncbi:MAG: DNA mismatch repair endonuclease MutL, partial [Pirellulaceae bacterium]
MPDITQLPTSVINKIAAGEVIERPASVIKELLENSVDAGATRIDVSIEKGGSELIRIADNGCGIAAEQLQLAVASHATSKIRDADDLFHVRTLGFRGEALASIAEISHFLIRSRTHDSSAGSELAVTAGTWGEIAPCGCPIGTSIEVRNLFCSTPVRRKFLRTTQTEMGHISEAFTRIALAHPAIHFTLMHNDRTLYDLPADDNWRERITTFFGREVGDAMIWVDNRDDESSVRLSGYVGNPSHSRSNNRMQYLFLNQRFIRDRSLQHALGEAYRGLLMTGRFAIAFLRLDMPAEMVDVNVHPTKLEVRFQDGGRVYSQLLGTLRSKFLASDLTAKESLAQEKTSDKEPAVDPGHADQLRREMTDWAKGATSGPRPATGGQTDVAPGSQQRMPLSYDRALGKLPEFQPFARGPLDPPSLPPRRDEPTPRDGSTDEFTPSSPPAARSQSPRDERSSIGLQLHNRYIVTENETGMVVIDQHALHERVLYEQIREKVLAGKMESQRLLVPEPVALTADEAGAALGVKETLAEIGIEIEPFGGDTVVISAYPAMLANISPAEILRQVVDILLGGEKKPDRRDVLDELLHMISCKAAIKAGDRLSVEEVDA